MGESSGHEAFTSSGVRRTPSPPSTCHIQSEPCPFRFESPPTRATTNWPSGVQAGSAIRSSFCRDTCRGLEPSASITHTLSWPSRSEMKAIREPSGEKAGWKFSAIPLSFVIGRASPPSIGRSQISPTMSKTRVPPSGETSTLVHVPSSVVKRMVRVSPRGVVTSQSSSADCAASLPGMKRRVLHTATATTRIVGQKCLRTTISSWLLVLAEPTSALASPRRRPPYGHACESCAHVPPVAVADGARHRSNQPNMCTTLLITLLGRAAIECEAPGMRTSAVGIFWSFRAW